MSDDPILIKAAVLGSAPQRIRPDRFEEVAAAERAVAAAEAEGARIREQAHAETEAIRAEARSLGYEDGRRLTAEAEVRLRAEAVRIRREAGERLIRLATTLATQVLDQELRSGPDAIRALVRKTVAQVSWCRTVTLRLHPEDARSLTEACPTLSALAAEGAELRLTPDPSLERGDCLVETDSGEVDGSARVQLAALELALLQTPETPEHDH